MTTNYLDISHQSIVSYVDFIALGTFIKWRVNGKLWLPSFFVEHSFDKHGMYCESKILCQTILFLYDSLDHTNSFTHLHKWSQWPPFPLLQVSCFKWNNEAWKSETWTLQRSSDPNTFISFTVMRTWQKVVASWNVAFFRIEYIYILMWLNLLGFYLCWLIVGCHCLTSHLPGAKYISFQQVVPNPDSDDFREMDHLADCCISCKTQPVSTIFCWLTLIKPRIICIHCQFAEPQIKLKSSKWALRCKSSTRLSMHAEGER